MGIWTKGGSPAGVANLRPAYFRPNSNHTYVVYTKSDFGR